MSLEHSLEGEMEKMLACVHCGLCLQACPTYVQLGDENESPRGRAYLMRGVAEHRLEIDETFVEHMELCLQCRACEVACPSGLNYGHIMEAAREEIASSAMGAKFGRRLRRFLLNQVLIRPGRLKIIFGLTRRLKRLGLLEWLNESQFAVGLPPTVRAALNLLLPDFKGLVPHREGRQVRGKRTRRVAFVEGCIMPELFGHINEATRQVLAANGCEVVSPDHQGCCGALHAHAGELEVARRLARCNIEAFEKTDCQAIIINAAGCGAALKEYSQLMADDPAYSSRAQSFSRKVKDITEYLVEIGFRRPTAAIDRRVTYDAPCHLIYAQRVTNAPLEILRSIPGIEFIAQPDAEACCGGAGIYNLLQPGMSGRLRSDKVKHIETTAAEIVATGNPGCQMQIASGLYLAGQKAIRVVHPIELLDLAYERSGFYDGVTGS